MSASPSPRRSIVVSTLSPMPRRAEGLREGRALRRGDLIGYVGATGNARADASHLHFAVFRLGPERQWWTGEAMELVSALH